MSVISTVESVPPPRCVKVLIADDTAVMREAIRSLLGNEPEIELVGETEDFAQTLTMACKLKPQVDVHMPNVANLTPMNVSETLRSYTTSVLAISIANDVDTQALAESYGAVILLDKMKLGLELIPAVMKFATTGKALRPGSHA